MRDAKNRKHEKKRVNKALANRKTAESRQRRLDNKTKREAIHAIDPEAKIKIIDQKTFIDVGYLNEVEVIGNKIKTVETEVIAIAKEAGMEVEPIIEVSTVEEVMKREGMIESVETTSFNKLKNIFKK